MTVMPSRLLALGQELDLSPTGVGVFQEADSLQEMDCLRQQMEQDGYLYLRDFWRREVEQAVRDSLTRQLDQLGFLPAGSSLDEARFNGREVGRALGNPLDQHDPLLRQLLFGSRMTEFFWRFWVVRFLILISSCFGPRGRVWGVPFIVIWSIWGVAQTTCIRLGSRWGMSVWSWVVCSV